ncbi:hypothetical protein C0Q70_14338 [Pomacea canaliculata]|uniref:PIF1/LRR1 pleckstrin homology domain-containing protein n=1 Tax=Pomacea canaliculata TaxID=400727 RepID=A0A2T7NZR4_POMCA|nr:hypothetical protein C0Q70_14338 [Pomacea canaliculata]
MRLNCEVEIINRLLPALNMKKQSRSSRAQVSIGRGGASTSKDAAIFLLICTAKDKAGSKYVVTGNICQIFNKFVSDGKATIRFKQPEEDICINKADPLQLKGLLSVLKKAAQGEDLGQVTLSTLQPLSATSLGNLKTKMTVLSRKDYPLTTSFPLSLRQLKNPGRWNRLSELRLAQNQLMVLPPVIWQSCLQETLLLLDVSGNTIEELPLQLCHLKNLIQLHVKNNKLRSLPPTVGSMQKLRVLTAANNAISQLPAGIARLRLESLDLFGNPLQLPDKETVTINNLGVPSLVDLSACVIRTQRLPYGADDLPPHLIHYLNNARVCWCGKYCFENAARCLTRCDLRSISETVIMWNTLGSTFIPVEAFLCSIKCLKNFQKNPYAHWRK